jgi:putative two-component system response regulator
MSRDETAPAEAGIGRVALTPRVLVVDDDNMIVAAVVRVLTGSGIHVCPARTAVEASGVLARHALDAAILDVGLPGVDGIALCRKIRGLAETRRLPVIFLTGNDEEAVIERAMAAGGDDYVLKPFRRRELLARVHAAIERFRAIRDLDDAESVLMSLARAVEAKDEATADHCDRLSRMAVALGRRLGLSDPDLDALRKGGILHDIGKIGVPDAILLKPGPLTSVERTIMKTHAVIGANLVAPLRTMGRTVEIVRHHHERFDGTGYPDGIKGDAIPRLARVFQVCDIFDALTTERPYKRAMTPGAALRILREETDRGWSDREAVAAFASMLS